MKIAKFDSYASKRVSYVLVTKNKARHLEKAMKNIKTFVKPEDELIIIDGASTDRTTEVIQKYHNLVEIYISEPDDNATEAFNKGILIAKGEFIKNLNDDDTIHAEAMEKAISVMDEHPEVDILLCGGTKQHGKYYSVFYVPDGINYGTKVEDVIRWGACGVGLIIRRKSLTKAGLLIPVEVSSDSAFLAESIFRGLTVKFCRLNLFNHPIYPHSTVIAKRNHLEKNEDSLLKYLPKKNYLFYKLKIFWKKLPRFTEKLYSEFPIFKGIFLPLRIIMVRINKNKIDRIRASTSKNIKAFTIKRGYKWDGGFS